jgi:hypothetical protein
MGMHAVQKAYELSEQLTALGKYNETSFWNAYIATKRITNYERTTTNVVQKADELSEQLTALNKYSISRFG